MLHYHPGKLAAQVQLIIIFQMVMVTKKYKKYELRSPKIWFFFLRSAIFPPVDHLFESRRTMRPRPGSRAVRCPRPSGHREKHRRLRGQRIRRCPVEVAGGMGESNGNFQGRLDSKSIHSKRNRDVATLRLKHGDCLRDGTYSARHDTKMLIYTAYCNQLLGVCGRISLADPLG